MQQLKRKLAEIDLERSQFKTQQQEVEDDVITLAQSIKKMGGEILNIRQDMAKMNQQLHEITLLLKQNIGQAGKFGEPTINLPPRKRRGKKETNSFLSNEERFGSWASDCESEEENKKARLMVQRASKIWWWSLVSWATCDTNTYELVDGVQRKHGRLMPFWEGQPSLNEATLHRPKYS
jgi:hypothetical protein